MIEEVPHLLDRTKGSELSQHVTASSISFDFDYLLAVEESKSIAHLSDCCRAVVQKSALYLAATPEQPNQPDVFPYVIM